MATARGRAQSEGGKAGRRTTAGHFRAMNRLMKQLYPVVLDNGWDFGTGPGIHIPPGRDDHRVPDLLVARHDVAEVDGNLVGAGVLLVAAIVPAPVERHEHLAVRPKAYATAGVALCLVADPTESLPVVTLFSHPIPVKERDAEERFVYARMTVVSAGEPLDLPEPFRITLDTAGLFR
jgi:hypothetical protein